MKKIFAFAMALVSMAAVMTSCNNDDTDFIEQSPAPLTIKNYADNGNQQQAAEAQSPKVVEFLLPVTDVQLEVMDIAITYEIGGQQKTITPADMTEVSFPARVEENDAAGTVKLLKYRVPGTYSMKDLRTATMERTVKLNEEGVAKYVGQHINLFLGYTCTIAGPGEEGYYEMSSFKYAAAADMTTTKGFDKALRTYQLMGAKNSLTFRL